MDCSLPGSSVHGIFQARAMEWGAIAFSSEENGWTQIQLILINLPQPCTPPHVYTKRKTPECLQSSLTSVVTAILCPSRSNWGPVSQPTFDRTEETPYISKASCFVFFFFFWTEIEILLHFSFSRIKLWVFEVFVPIRDDSLGWDNVEWVFYGPMMPQSTGYWNC